MAGDTYDPNMHAVPIPDNDGTPSEERPGLDHALPPPPPMAQIQDLLIGDVAPAGQAFIRVVSQDGQSDIPDGTA